MPAGQIPSKREKVDRRTQKTKLAIRKALFSLLKEKNIESITVTELSREANIDRKTFYLHYRGLNDVLDEFESDIVDYAGMAAATAKSGDGDAVEVFFRCVNDMIRDNLEVLKRFVGTTAYLNLLKKVSDTFTRALMEQIVRENPDWDGETVKYAEMVSYAGLYSAASIYLKWIEDGSGMPLEQVADLARRFAVSGIASMTDYLSGSSGR